MPPSTSSSSNGRIQRIPSSGLQRRARLQNGSGSGDAADEAELVVTNTACVVPTTREIRTKTSPPTISIDAPFITRRRSFYQWSRAHKRLVSLVLLIFLPSLLLRKWILWIRNEVFGEHYIIGGIAGSIVQSRGLNRVYYKTLRKQEQELREMGVVLPAPLRSGTLLDIQTQAAMRELLIRRERRGRILFALEEKAMKSPCRRDDDYSYCTIPQVIFVPSMDSWNPPRPGTLSGFDRLLFDEFEMRDLVKDVMPLMVPNFDSSGHHQKVYLWALCAVYHFGGIFIGSFHHIEQRLLLSDDDDDDLLATAANSIFNNGTSTSRGPLGIAALENATHYHDHRHHGHGRNHKDGGLDIYMIAATPRHAHLGCILGSLETNTSLSSIPELLYQSSSSVPQINVWSGFRTSTGTKAKKRCSTTLVKDAASKGPGTSPAALEELNGESRPNFFILHTEAPRIQAASMHDATVTITSLDSHKSSAIGLRTAEKVTIRSQLQRRGSEPNWFCTHCLRLPNYGTMRDCSRVCPKRYTGLVCHGSDIPAKVDVPMKLIVSGESWPSIIPRIIHQTWFEQVNMDRYPDLARLQNSWKKSGWEYRFHTDETARQYIVNHFPTRFVDAFDALIPGAYRADLFRYLVLLREGGVYADMDVLLETTLDTFITPTMSFFVPRDTVAEFAGEPFCLWNGLIGAAPGHPFIVRTVERLVNLVLDRADAYDMERELCRQHANWTGDMNDNDKEPFEIWKARLESLLLLSGPCALGVAVNEVLGRSSLQALELGWIGLDALDYGTPRQGEHSIHDYGDAMILTLDKYDLGAFRFSDPERSIIVASTQLEGTEKKPQAIRHPTLGERQRREEARANAKPNIHYSKTAKGVVVWGNKGVYKDNLVSPERLTFQIHYER